MREYKSVALVKQTLGPNTLSIICFRLAALREIKTAVMINVYFYLQCILADKFIGFVASQPQIKFHIHHILIV